MLRNLASKHVKMSSPFLRLWKEHFSRSKKRISVIIVLMIVSGLITGMYPLIIRMAFDRLSDHASVTLYTIPLIILLLTSLRAFVLCIQTRITNSMVSRIELALQKNLFNHLLTLKLLEIVSRGPTQFVQHLTTDFSYIRDALTRCFTVLIRDAFNLIALIVFLIYIDWSLTLFALILIPAVAIPLARFGQHIRTLTMQIQHENGTMASIVHETLSSLDQVKVYNLYAYAASRIDRALRAVYEAKIKVINTKAKVDPLIELVTGVAMAGVLFYVGHKIAHKTHSVGDFSGYISALLLAAHPVRTLSNFSGIMQEANSALERYYTYLNLETEQLTGAVPAILETDRMSEIEFRSVTFSYGQSAPVLDSFSYRFSPGSVTAIVGPSGSGKTSLLHLIPRFYIPSSGTITLNGHDIQTLDLETLRSHVSLVSQDCVLFDGTIEDNIRLGKVDASFKEIQDAAMKASAEAFIKAKPSQYNYRVGPGGAFLSGGERQRIIIARAFLKNAKILLLDEATSALDPDSERNISKALKQLMSKRTTLMIAHRLSLIHYADTIVVIEKGKLIESGSHDALIQFPNVYAKHYHLHKESREHV